MDTDNYPSGKPLPPRARTATLSATGTTDWLLLLGTGEHAFAAELEEVVASVAGTFIVEAKQIVDVAAGTYGETKTILSSTLLADFPQVGRLVGEWAVRFRCSAYTSGSFKLSISR